MPQKDTANIERNQNYTLYVHFLGSFDIQINAEPTSLPASGNARSLLAYLLYHHRKHTRSVLVGVFWPELPEDRARRALSQSLWHIRRCLPEAIQTDAEHVSISPEIIISIDAKKFENLIRHQIASILLYDSNHHP